MDYRWLQRSMYRCRSIIQWSSNTENETLRYTISFLLNPYAIIGMSNTGPSVSATTPLEVTVSSITNMECTITGVINNKHYSIAGFYIIIGI